MKSEKAVTLTSLITYLVLIFIVLGILLTISTNFQVGIKNINDEGSNGSEYNKVNLYFLEEVKKEGNTIVESGQSFITFSSGNKYEFKSNDKAIYLINNKIVRIANEVELCNFEVNIQDEKTIIKLTIRVTKQENAKVFEYVMGYGDVNNNYENEENYVFTKTYSLSDVNTSGVEMLNLFDINNANTLNMYIDETNHRLLSNANTKSVYIACTPNTTYSIYKIASSRLVIGAFTTLNENEVADVYASNEEEGENLTNLTITTGNTSSFLVLYYYNSELDTDITLNEISNSIKICENSLYEVAVLLQGLDSSSNLIEEIKYINLNEPLRKIDGVVSDELDVENGKVKRYIIENGNKAVVLFTPQMENVIFPIADNIVGDVDYSIIFGN